MKTAANVTQRRRRCVAYTQSTDLLTWPPQPLLILTPDDLDDFGNWTTNFYGMPVIHYEGVFIGLLWVFRATDPEGYWCGIDHPLVRHQIANFLAFVFAFAFAT